MKYQARTERTIGNKMLDVSYPLHHLADGGCLLHHLEHKPRPSHHETGIPSTTMDDTERMGNTGAGAIGTSSCSFPATAWRTSPRLDTTTVGFVESESA